MIYCLYGLYHGDIQMTVDNIDVEATVRKVRELLTQETNISPALKTVLEVLLVLVIAMLNRLTLNSKNSSTPPSKVTVHSPRRGE